MTDCPKDFPGPWPPYHQVVRGGDVRQYTRRSEWSDGAGRLWVRSYQLLEADLHALFETVEPTDTNCATHGHRILGLLMRACIECEAHLKAMLAAGSYDFAGQRLNMTQYRATERSHLLSRYVVDVLEWRGAHRERRPFAAWGSPGGPSSPFWYQAYNAAKHSRVEAFESASLTTLVDAVAGCLVLLVSRFGVESYGGPELVSEEEGGRPGFSTGQGGRIGFRYPRWEPDEEYPPVIAAPGSMTPFQRFAYGKI
jgi:hypothetical protein